MPQCDACLELLTINDDRIICGECEKDGEEEAITIGAQRVLDAVGRQRACSECGGGVWFVRRPWSAQKVASSPPLAGWLAFDANGEPHSCKETT